VVVVGNGSDKLCYLAYHFPIFFSPRTARERAAVVGPRFRGASRHGIVREVTMLEGAGAPARVLSAARTAAPMGCGVGLDPSTRANYVPQFLSLDFSRRTLALAGVKRRARSYSLHFSRASPPSPFPGLALLAPALHPFLPPLLSVIILLTHLLVVSRTPLSGTAHGVCGASLLLPPLPLPLPSLLSSDL
jgi:hypothetical protein